ARAAVRRLYRKHSVLRNAGICPGRAGLPCDPVASWRTGSAGQPDESGGKIPRLQPGTAGSRHPRTLAITRTVKKAKKSPDLCGAFFAPERSRYKDASHSCGGAYHQELVTGWVNSSKRSRMPSSFMPYILRSR